ncbi:hypothetical protein [Spirillospora sp. NPDC048819]|uniref:hypothetical protein n=1 Tax=Spirillospora sp. NPDC048819 TaxID=3155268 RepID=UPI0033E9A8E1
MTDDRPVAVPGTPGPGPPHLVPPRPVPAPAPADPGPPVSGSPDIGTADTGPPVFVGGGRGAGEVRALIRTQLRIALGTCAIVMITVTGLPVLLATVPAVARARVHGVPLWWLVLALGVQPLWIAVSQWQLRRAERAERDLARPVGHP